MVLFKSLVGGVVGALLVGATWLAAEFTFLFLKAYRLMGSQTEGSGGLGSVGITSYVPEAALIGFLAGVWWEWRRARRPKTRA
jgi:hypothetical protein